MRKRIVIIAGPNGAGKTTFAREFLPNEAGCPIFVNADLIAAGGLDHKSAQDRPIDVGVHAQGYVLQGV
jgi:predicted ABC-type ATPase